MKQHWYAIVTVCALFLASMVQAQEIDSTTKEFETFRALMEADNPAEIYEDAGEQMWKAKRTELSTGTSKKQAGDHKPRCIVLNRECFPWGILTAAKVQF